MANWFKSDTVVCLEQKIKQLTEEIEVFKRVNEAMETWRQSMINENLRMRIQCEMYDKVMKSLNINVSLNGKTK